MAKTPAERQRAAKARRTEAGLVRVPVWIPDTPEAREALKQAASEINAPTPPTLEGSADTGGAGETLE